MLFVHLRRGEHAACAGDRHDRCEGECRRIAGSGLGEFVTTCGVRIPVVLDVAVGAFSFAHVQRFAAGADAARVADLAGGFIPCDSHDLTVHASRVRFDQAYEGSQPVSSTLLPSRVFASRAGYRVSNAM